MTKRTRSVAMLASLLALATYGLAIINRNMTSAQEQEGTSQSSRARSMRRERTRIDTKDFARRGDIRRLPPLLKARLIELAARPHTFEPITAFSEAADPSQRETRNRFIPSALDQEVLLSAFVRVKS